MAKLTSKQKLTILAGLIVALGPSFFSYLQARQEIKEKYKNAHADADAGYKTLAASVEELRKTVQAQHTYITKLEGHVEALEKLSGRRFAGTIRVGTPGTVGHGAGSGAGRGIGNNPDPVPTVALEPAGIGRPAAPDFKPLPADLSAAKEKLAPPED